MKDSRLRGLPSVEKVVQALGETSLPRSSVLHVIRAELSSMRKEGTIPSFEVILSRIKSAVAGLRASRLQTVINGTGVILHTNFGRAPLGHAVIEKLAKIGSQYCNLEYALEGGTRGGRAAYLEHNLALLCEAEAATAVNNNAAALILILRYFCAGETGSPQQGARNEVVVSRGELIQIGGGFRVPDILESSGARLREVGTTNQTSAADYAKAITRNTALLLKIHRSNFSMSGFVSSPSTEEIAAIARRKKIPFVEDLGSGALIATERFAGLQHEPTPAETLRRGVDAVCFSGDKLMGGPQAGIIAGKRKLIVALKQEPLFRALRCDKLILAALETTTDIYLRQREEKDSQSKRTKPGEEPGTCGTPKAASRETRIPVLEMLDITNEQLQDRAEKILSALAERGATAYAASMKVEAGVGKAQLGGGTLPRASIASVTLDLTHDELKPQEIAARLRMRKVPIVGYIERGKVKLDLRTIFPHQDQELIAAIRDLTNET